jgi:hypothetical protein
MPVFAGCSAIDDTTDSSKRFTDFTVLNRTDADISFQVEVRHEDSLVFEERVTVRGDDMDQLVDELDNRTGSFSVHVESADDDLSVSLPPETDAQEYSLVVVVENSGLTALTTQ